MSYYEYAQIGVVLNGRFGGFHLSKKALLWMAERGHPVAMEAVEAAEKDGNWDLHGYGSGFSRHDPVLVEAVETLGVEASSPFSELVVEHISLGYSIHNYDGMERLGGDDDSCP